MSNNKPSLAILIPAALLAGNAAAQCAGSANSSLINLLGSAGPSNFSVLSLGGSNAVVNINLATVDGPVGTVGMANKGSIKESAKSLVTGNLIVGSR